MSARAQESLRRELKSTSTVQLLIYSAITNLMSVDIDSLIKQLSTPMCNPRVNHVLQERLSTKLLSHFQSTHSADDAWRH